MLETLLIIIIIMKELYAFVVLLLLYSRNKWNKELRDWITWSNFFIYVGDGGGWLVDRVGMDPEAQKGCSFPSLTGIVSVEDWNTRCPNASTELSLAKSSVSYFDSEHRLWSVDLLG